MDKSEYKESVFKKKILSWSSFSGRQLVCRYKSYIQTSMFIKGIVYFWIFSLQGSLYFSVEQLQCEVRAAGLDSEGLREVGGPAALTALYRAGSLCEGSQASGAAGRTWRWWAGCAGRRGRGTRRWCIEGLLWRCSLWSGCRDGTGRRCRSCSESRWLKTEERRSLRQTHTHTPLWIVNI